MFAGLIEQRLQAINGFALISEIAIKVVADVIDYLIETLRAVVVDNHKLDAAGQ